MDAEMQEHAFKFIFGPKRDEPLYTATRVVWGLELEFQVLSGVHIEATEEAVELYTSAGARQYERCCQWLARTILNIGGTPFVPPLLDDTTPEATENIRARTATIRRWGGPLVDACIEQMQEVIKEFRELLDSETLKNLQGAVAESGNA